MNILEVKICMTQKIEVIEKLIKNHEFQLRFIRRREMRGMKRLLRERAELIENFITVDKQLRSHGSLEQVAVYADLMQEIETKQLIMLDLGKQAVQAAIAEQHNIAEELRNVKTNHQLANYYSRPWPLMTAGRRFSLKG